MKMHTLDTNGNQDGQDAYADKEDEIYNCNMHHKQSV